MCNRSPFFCSLSCHLCLPRHTSVWRVLLIKTYTHVLFLLILRKKPPFDLLLLYIGKIIKKACTKTVKEFGLKFNFFSFRFLCEEDERDFSLNHFYLQRYFMFYKKNEKKRDLFTTQFINTICVCRFFFFPFYCISIHATRNFCPFLSVFFLIPLHFFTFVFFCLIRNVEVISLTLSTIHYSKKEKAERHEKWMTHAWSWFNEKTRRN